MQIATADLKQTAIQDPRPLWLLLFVSMFLAAAILLVAAVHWFQTGDHYANLKSVTFQGSKLELVIGKGKATDEALLIENMSERGFAFVATQPTELNAREYKQLNWFIGGLMDSSQIRLAWSSDSVPGQMHESPIAHQASGAGSIDLTVLGQWRGTITALGLIVAAPGPVSIYEMELRPITPNAKGILTEIFSEWTAFEGWHPYSINYIVGGARDPLLPPVPAAAVWALSGYLIYMLGVGIGRGASSFAVFTLCGLAAWVLLDARWQLDLIRQLSKTKAEFAGLSSEQKRERGEDGQLYRFIQQVKSHLPEEPSRILIISSDPKRGGATYLSSAHAHYYLLPHNVYSRLAALPGLKKLSERKIAYLVVLPNVTEVRYDAERRELVGSGPLNRVPAELILESDHGSLYRLLGAVAS